MNTMKLKRILTLIYVLVAIVTFGHAWHRDYSNTLDNAKLTDSEQ